jgi:hypothetical protein
MIFTKGSSSETNDTPPAYEDLVINPQSVPNDEKSDYNSRLARIEQHSPNTVPGESSTVLHSPRPAVNKRWFSWFGERDTERQIKETVQSLVSQMEYPIKHIFIFSQFSPDTRCYQRAKVSRSCVNTPVLPRSLRSARTLLLQYNVSKIY